MPCRHDGQTYDRNAAREIGRIVFAELDLRLESNDHETLHAEMSGANKPNSPPSAFGIILRSSNHDYHAGSYYQLDFIFSSLFSSF